MLEYDSDRSAMLIANIASDRNTLSNKNHPALNYINVSL